MDRDNPPAPPLPHPPEIGSHSGSPPRVRVRRKRSNRVVRLWRRCRRPVRWVLAGLGVLAAVLAIDLGVRYLPAARALAHGRDVSLQAQALLSADLGHVDRARLEQAAQLLTDARDDFGSRSSAIGDGWSASILAHLPILDRQIQAARSLRSAGEAATQLGLDLIPLLEEVVPDPGRAAEPTLVRVTRGIRSHQPALAAARADLDALSSATATIPPGLLLGPLDSARRTVEREAPRIQGAVGPALGLLGAVPTAVGEGTRTYLLLFENPTEERPAGGFLGAIGEAVFVDGSLASATFEDPAIFNPRTRALRAPKALDTHLFNGRPMELADSNWAADFPAASNDIAHLYQVATGHTVDGVISVDPIALGYVLAVRGAVTVPPYLQTITADNALVELDYIANSVRPGDPGKVFLPPFGRIVLDRIITTPLAQLPAVAEALQRGAREKHVVLHFNDPSLQTLVDNGGFGGRVTHPLSDAVFVDDANLSGTKGDLTVTRTYHLTARIDRDGQVHDHLVLSYHNPTPRDRFLPKLEIGSGGAYRDYVRVYVPEAAQLERISLSLNGGKASQIAPETTEWEYEREAIAYWLIVPRGGDAELILDYTGPFADASRTPERYGLVWAKQVNALTWPMSVEVRLPDGRTEQWSSDLETDRSWEVTSG